MFPRQFSIFEEKLSITVVKDDALGAKSIEAWWCNDLPQQTQDGLKVRKINQTQTIPMSISPFKILT